MDTVKISDIIKIMDSIAPENTQVDYDNAGFLVGDVQDKVTGIVLALDVTDSVIEFAKQNNCNLIITHHPLIFSPIKRVTTDTAVGGLVFRLIKNGISLYSAHTNFDKAKGGTDDILAEVIGMQNTCRLDTNDTPNSGFGRIGTLPGINIKSIKESLYSRLGFMPIATADDNKIINTVASCAGAGSDCIPYALKQNADLFITGEVSYHCALDAKRMGLDIMLLSHSNSEQIAINFLKNTLQNRLKGVQYSVRVILAPFELFWH